MKNNYDHIDLDANPGRTPERFFEQTEIPYARSREDAWAELEKRIEKTSVQGLSNFRIYRTTFAIAASLLLLAGIFSILRFYSTSVYAPSGRHLSYTLPDGSIVQLNAESGISYKTFWWRFAREVKLEGEAYFEVTKGKQFEVMSEMGRTQVLGTSFNIYARNNEYNVTCFSGKVKVISNTSSEVVLSPEYEAKINSDGNIIVSKEIKSGINVSWVNNMFHFTARPLPLVLHEIERQFNIKITSKANLDYSYTGYFSKNRTPAEVLDFVCKPFGLTFAKISENEYEIY